MNAIAIMKAIDMAITLITGLMNLVGASKIVSDTIAKRIAEGGRDWTDEERAAVQGELEASKAYAADEIAKAKAAGG
jgi:hypothetical protein